MLTVTQLSKCNKSISENNSPVVTVYRATSQHWTGGAIGSGKGIYYQFYLPAADSVYRFDSAWVDGYRLSVKRVSSVANSDTLILQANAFFSNEGFGNQSKSSQPDSVILPDDKKNCAAVIRYNFHGKLSAEFCVTKVQVLPRLNYP